MGADRRYGAGRRWLVLTPALSLSKRGDQSRAQGRSNAVQATLAPMFCPLLKGRGTGKPCFPVQAFSWEDAALPHPLPGQGYGETWFPRVQSSLFVGGRSPPAPSPPGRGTGKPGFPGFNQVFSWEDAALPPLSPGRGTGKPGFPVQAFSWEDAALPHPPLKEG